MAVTSLLLSVPIRGLLPNPVMHTGPRDSASHSTSPKPTSPPFCVHLASLLFFTSSRSPIPLPVTHSMAPARSFALLPLFLGTPAPGRFRPHPATHRPPPPGPGAPPIALTSPRSLGASRPSARPCCSPPPPPSPSRAAPAHSPSLPGLSVVPGPGSSLHPGPRTPCGGLSGPEERAEVPGGPGLPLASAGGGTETSGQLRAGGAGDAGTGGAGAGVRGVGCVPGKRRRPEAREPRAEVPPPGAGAPTPRLCGAPCREGTGGGGLAEDARPRRPRSPPASGLEQFRRLTRNRPINRD